MITTSLLILMALLSLLLIVGVLIFTTFYIEEGLYIIVSLVPILLLCVGILSVAYIYCKNLEKEYEDKKKAEVNIRNEIKSTLRRHKNIKNVGNINDNDNNILKRFKKFLNSTIADEEVPDVPDTKGVFDSLKPELNMDMDIHNEDQDRDKDGEEEGDNDRNKDKDQDDDNPEGQGPGQVQIQIQTQGQGQNYKKQIELLSHF